MNQDDKNEAAPLQNTQTQESPPFEIQRPRTISEYVPLTPGGNTQTSPQSDEPVLKKKPIDHNMSPQINKLLENFQSLANSYNYGSDKSAVSGLNIDKCTFQKRPSLIPTFLQGKSMPYGPLTGKEINEPYSSCEESEVDVTGMDPQTHNTQAHLQHKGGPRIKDVVEQILDLSCIKQTSDPVPNTNNYLLVDELDPQYTSDKLLKRFYTWINNCQSRQDQKDFQILKNVKVKTIHVFHNQAYDDQQQKKSFGLVGLGNTQELEITFKMLNRFQKFILDEAGRPVSIFLCYDARLVESWVGVILRNLPQNTVPAKVIERLQSQLKFKILRCSPVQQISKQNCAVVNVADIDDAEALCQVWNNYQFSAQNSLSAHMHPFSCRKRSNNKLSIHLLFKHLFKEPIKKEELVQQLEPVKTETKPTNLVIKEEIKPATISGLLSLTKIDAKKPSQNPLAQLIQKRQIKEFEKSEQPSVQFETSKRRIVETENALYHQER